MKYAWKTILVLAGSFISMFVLGALKLLYFAVCRGQLWAAIPLCIIGGVLFAIYIEEREHHYFA